MRKVSFTLVIFISFLLLTSIASAQFRLVPLDIISNFFNSILKSLGLTATTAEKTIPSSGTIVYCNSLCKAKGFSSGTCRNGGTG